MAIWGDLAKIHPGGQWPHLMATMAATDLNEYKKCPTLKVIPKTAFFHFYSPDFYFEMTAKAGNTNVLSAQKDLYSTVSL